MIAVCRKCGAKYKLPPRYRGVRFRCKQCKARVVVGEGETLKSDSVALREEKALKRLKEVALKKGKPPVAPKPRAVLEKERRDALEQSAERAEKRRRQLKEMKHEALPEEGDEEAVANDPAARRRAMLRQIREEARGESLAAADEAVQDDETKLGLEDLEEPPVTEDVTVDDEFVGTVEMDETGDSGLIDVAAEVVAEPVDEDVGVTGAPGAAAVEEIESVAEVPAAPAAGEDEVEEVEVAPGPVASAEETADVAAPSPAEPMTDSGVIEDLQEDVAETPAAEEPMPTPSQEAYAVHETGELDVLLEVKAGPEESGESSAVEDAVAEESVVDEAEADDIEDALAPPTEDEWVDEPMAEDEEPRAGESTAEAVEESVEPFEEDLYVEEVQEEPAAAAEAESAAGLFAFKPAVADDETADVEEPVAIDELESSDAALVAGENPEMAEPVAAESTAGAVEEEPAAEVAPAAAEVKSWREAEVALAQGDLADEEDEALPESEHAAAAGVDASGDVPVAEILDTQEPAEIEAWQMEAFVVGPEPEYHDASELTLLDENENDVPLAIRVWLPEQVEDFGVQRELAATCTFCDARYRVPAPYRQRRNLRCVVCSNAVIPEKENGSVAVPRASGDMFEPVAEVGDASVDIKADTVDEAVVESVPLEDIDVESDTEADGKGLDGIGIEDLGEQSRDAIAVADIDVEEDDAPDVDEADEVEDVEDIEDIDDIEDIEDIDDIEELEDEK